MPSDDRIVKALERIRARLHPEPENAPLRDLIDLLMTIHCEHDWTTRRMGGDPANYDSNEPVTVCSKCGREK